MSAAAWPRCTLAAALLALAQSAAAQANAPMSDPSAAELRAALFPAAAEGGATTRSWTRTAPPSSDGHCPGAGASAEVQVSGTRSLVVIPLAVAESAARVDLAIRFELNSDAIAPSSRKALDTLASVLNEPSAVNARFTVAGHTDASGNDALNLPLSCARAIAVRKHLLARGVAADRLSAYGFGSAKPLAGTSASDAVNRRVEIRRAEQ